MADIQKFLTASSFTLGVFHIRTPPDFRRYSHMGLHFMFVLPEAEDDISWRRVEGFEALLFWNVLDS